MGLGVNSQITVLGIILEKKIGGPGAWTRGP
jgi:hypothetical protein